MVPMSSYDYRRKSKPKSKQATETHTHTHRVSLLNSLILCVSPPNQAPQILKSNKKNNKNTRARAPRFSSNSSYFLTPNQASQTIAAHTKQRRIAKKTL
jgi:hypothetical protein